jgi:hypothetical protein
MKWIKSKFKGVRYRVHPTRKHGVQPDKYFAPHYKLTGKVHDEPVRRASEGSNAEKAALKLAEPRRNQKAGTSPTTLKETWKDRVGSLRIISAIQDTAITVLVVRKRRIALESLANDKA